MSEANLGIKHTCFVADLHLAEERPEASGRFFHFIDTAAKGSEALYILGDLFEYWVGDDDLDSSVARQTAFKLKELADSGTPVFFMHGNRDFLLAKRYAERCGMTLLQDPTLINLHGTPTLLSHGDILCTDDKSYQRYRKLPSNRLIRRLLLALPLGWRHALAGAARKGSEKSKSGKAYDVMDVNHEAVVGMFTQYSVTRMIHGHTHRPGRHEISCGNQHCERWVLPDWYAEGGYLVCSDKGCELFPVPSPSGSGS